MEALAGPRMGHISFGSNRDGHVAIFQMNLDGSDVTPLTPEGLQFIAGYDWSPDGSRNCVLRLG